MTASAQTTTTEAPPVEAATTLEALVPAWPILDQLVAIGVLPPQAAEVIVRVRLERMEWSAPGAICRRIANAEDAPASLIERCRAANQNSDTIAPAAACRRVAAADNPAESLVERCRVWLTSEASGPTAAEVCRRIAKAESVDESLVERCRTILADDTTRLNRLPNERPTERPVDRPAERPAERPTRPASPATR